MKLMVVQLNFGYGVAVRSPIYMVRSRQTCLRRIRTWRFTSTALHRDRPDFECTTQDLVFLPIDAATPFLCRISLGRPHAYGPRPELATSKRISGQADAGHSEDGERSPANE